MSTGFSNMTDVLDRRAAVVERKLVATRKKQADRLQTIREIEVACIEHEKRMRRLCTKANDSITVQHMREASHDGRHRDQAVKKMRALVSTLRIEVGQIATQCSSQCKALAGIRRKADFLRDRRNVEHRKASRRQLARDLAGD